MLLLSSYLAVSYLSLKVAESFLPFQFSLSEGREQNEFRIPSWSCILFFCKWPGCGGRFGLPVWWIGCTCHLHVWRVLSHLKVRKAATVIKRPWLLPTHRSSLLEVVGVWMVGTGFGMPAEQGRLKGVGYPLLSSCLEQLSYVLIWVMWILLLLNKVTYRC